MRRVVYLLAVLTGCVAPSPPEDNRKSAHTAPPAAPAPPMPPPRLPERAEVEITGRVARPAGESGTVRVWITDGPCWQSNTRALGMVEANPDGFFIEVFVPQGTKMWACAALMPAPGGPLRIYGAAQNAPFVGKGFGEVLIGNLQIPLTSGKPVSPPLPYKH
jgi:hypothetical protein